MEGLKTARRTKDLIGRKIASVGQVFGRDGQIELVLDDGTKLMATFATGHELADEVNTES